jgi:hypothetical protein
MSKEVLIMDTTSSNMALFAYDQGFIDFQAQVIQEIDAEIQRLGKYGRTELYGLHKTREIVLRLGEPPQENATAR